MWVFGFVVYSLLRLNLVLRMAGRGGGSSSSSSSVVVGDMRSIYHFDVIGRGKAIVLSNAYESPVRVGSVVDCEISILSKGNLLVGLAGIVV